MHNPTFGVFAPAGLIHLPPRKIAEILAKPEISPFGLDRAKKWVEWELKGLYRPHKREHLLRVLSILEQHADIKHPKTSFRNLDIGEYFIVRGMRKLYLKTGEATYINPLEDSPDPLKWPVPGLTVLHVRNCHPGSLYGG